jgi:Na+/proline symporter
MLAATMSALSGVYNMVSSILSRDVYQGLIKPDTSDKGLLKVGRAFSVAIGLTVTILAVVFVTSQFGIFNLMQVFFTLLNIPVVVPVVFGLLFRRVPKWSAVASIVWGLIVGITTRYMLGWDIGPQVYISLVLSFGIFSSSYWLGELQKTNKGRLALVAAAVAVVNAVFFFLTIGGEPQQWQMILGPAMGVVLGISVFPLARLFASETEEERQVVREFFKKLDTPVDVAKEVFGAGKKQVSTFPVVGGITMVMGLLILLLFLTDLNSTEQGIVAVMAGIMILFGFLMWFFGKKSEIRTASQYTDTGE